MELHRYNCQKKPYTFFKKKLCKNEEAEIGKKKKQFKKTLRVGSSTESYNNNYSYFF